MSQGNETLDMIAGDVVDEAVCDCGDEAVCDCGHGVNIHVEAEYIAGCPAYGCGGHPQVYRYCSEWECDCDHYHEVGDEPRGAGSDPYGRPSPYWHPEYWRE